jgi:hypothetical protein
MEILVMVKKDPNSEVEFPFANQKWTLNVLLYHEIVMLYFKKLRPLSRGRFGSLFFWRETIDIWFFGLILFFILIVVFFLVLFSGVSILLDI